jgi:hypothetical protein
MPQGNPKKGQKNKAGCQKKQQIIDHKIHNGRAKNGRKHI